MKTKYFIVVLFVIYFVILVRLIVFKYPSSMVFDIADGNFIPFKTIVPYLMGQPTWIVAIYNIGGNIVSFLPLGFFVPIIYGRLPMLKRVFVAALLVSVVLEGTQVLLRAGVFDVDDIILNVLGGVAGYGVFVLIASFLPTNTRYGSNTTVKNQQS